MKVLSLIRLSRAHHKSRRTSNCQTVIFLNHSGRTAANPTGYLDPSMDIGAVPELVNMALGVFAGAALLAGGRRAWQRQRISAKADLTIG